MLRGGRDRHLSISRLRDRRPPEVVLVGDHIVGKWEIYHEWSEWNVEYTPKIVLAGHRIVGQ